MKKSCSGVIGRPDFALQASSVSEPNAHICVKPEIRATTRRAVDPCQRDRRKPNEDAVKVPSGLNGRLREVDHEY
jgi:hypothetical protein